MSDYKADFASFRENLCPVEGDHGPRAIVPPWLKSWYEQAFPLPEGNPAARNILDCRTK